MSWGTPVRGCEARALEVFNELLGLLGRMQQDGRIEGFDVVLLTPNGDLNGYVTMKGSVAQISALRDDEELMRVTIEGDLVVDGLRYVDGYTNEGVARQLEMYQDAISRVPQRA
jgi:hypothetical protein